jgi:hypothetical protein
MKAFQLAVGDGGRIGLASFVMAGLLSVGPAVAGPVVRQAAGANAAAIQGAVDQFRADLGGPSNGNAVGTQPAGRREINWDGGGATAPSAIIPTPMPTFQSRGATFFTPGTGFSQSGLPTPEFAELNPSYPTLFTSFSSPRIFTALNSNVSDTVFHVPGNPAIPAAVTGFGAVFTDVDGEFSTKMEFYAPDGKLIYETFVPWVAGSDTLSFLGVSFNAGELVSRVRIISGNAAPGPDETGSLDLVMMDDFIYGEPVATQGLALTPESGRIFRTAGFDLVVGIQLPTGVSLSGGRLLLDGADVSAFLISCFRQGTGGGGQTYSCSIPGSTLSAGDHTLQAEITLSDQTRRRNAVRWTVIQ